MRDGKSMAAFCVQAEIGKQTFDNWCDVHPEFAEAYDVARSLGQLWWEDHAETASTEPGFNANFFKLTMVNRFNCDFEKQLKVKNFAKAKTHQDKLQVVAEQIEKGTINQKEATTLAQFIQTASNIEQQTDVIKRLDALEETK